MQHLDKIAWLNDKFHKKKYCKFYLLHFFTKDKIKFTYLYPIYPASPHL